MGFKKGAHDEFLGVHAEMLPAMSGGLGLVSQRGKKILSEGDNVAGVI